MSDPRAAPPPRADAGRLPERPGRTSLALLLVFGAVFLALGLQQAWADSPTFDEPVYVAAGISSLTTHDLRINPEHPPLAKALAALPALFAHPVIPHTAAWHRGDERVYSAEFLQAQLKAGTLQRVMFLARLVPLLEALLAGCSSSSSPRRLFGEGAGTKAALLWWAGPLVLGLGHLDGIDLPFTLAALLVTLTLIRVLEVDRDDPSTRWRLLALGLACGAGRHREGHRTAAGRAGAGGGARVGVEDSPMAIGRRRASVVGVTAWLLVWVVYVGDRARLPPAPGPAPPAGPGRAPLPRVERHHVRSRLPARFVVDRRAVVVLAGHPARQDPDDDRLVPPAGVRRAGRRRSRRAPADPGRRRVAGGR